MPTLTFDFWTPASPLEAGTALPLYYSILFRNANIAQSRQGGTGVGEHGTINFEIADSASAVTSAAVRLNGLAPDAADNWLPNRIKITYGQDVLIDTAWDLPFDEDHRSHELYRLDFDPVRSGEVWSDKLR